MSFDDPFYANTANIDGNSSNNFYNFNDEDPAAEFLEREKRELGDITGNEVGNSSDDPFNTRSTNNNILTNGAYSPTGSNSPTPSSGSPYQALAQLNEPEKIRKWREEFSARIEKKRFGRRNQT